MMEDKNLNCECEDEVVDQEVEQVNLEDLSKEELIQVIEQLSNPIVDMSEADGTPVDFDEFYKGVEKASYFAGMFQTLVSAGMSADNAYEIALNEHTSMYNLELAKLNNESQVEISKNNAIQIDKNTI